MDYFSQYNKPEVYSNPSITRQAILAHNEGHYSLIVSDKRGNTMLCLKHKSKTHQESKLSIKPSINTNKHVTPEVCVELCRNILGLKVNEIAKIIGISRATLDLHRKGASVKDKEMQRYQQLSSFAININELYGDSLKRGMRNVLIERKTVVQHMIQNAGNLDNIMPLIDNASKTLGAVRVSDEAINPNELHASVAGVGAYA